MCSKVRISLPRTPFAGHFVTIFLFAMHLEGNGGTSLTVVRTVSLGGREPGRTSEKGL